MNPIDYGKGMKTKLIAWKAKMDDLIRKIAIRGSKESEKVLRKNQDLKMPITEMSSRIEQFNNERPTEWASQMKNIDNGSRRYAWQICAAASAFLDRALR